ncbi:DNA recombination protein RmuC [Klebsiella pneumoniae]|uniref:DNA recombination protein RmuC n=1 Tax=Klebsiella pneumoniae TaxID=573 RepID=A0A2X3CWG9_KLEPN|nr:DNA recombination protein RmuC [Klebsiella pneumoniae]
MDLSIIISAVIALAAGLMVGWLATKARADQIRADLIEERRELDIELERRPPATGAGGPLA